MTARLRQLAWIAVAALGAVLLYAVLRLAWLSDDAYITLRSVENLLRGHGPVWNVGERVQAFTHPLWFWLLAGARGLTGEHYFTTIGLSVLLSLGAVTWLALAARRAAVGFAVLAACVASRTFGDYATSGLETPLTVLLLVALARSDADRADDGRRGDERSREERRFGTIALLTGLLGTTRLDLLAIALPVLLAHLRGERLLQRLPTVGLGLSPLILWSAFATFYYGSPFPITAYAKAFAPGIPAGELWEQGLRYLEHTLRHDPVTVAVIATGVGVGLAAARLRARALAIGALLSCLYVARVGGDFMAGRFLLPAYVVALAVLARGLARSPAWSGWSAGLALLLAAWVPGPPPFLSAPSADVVELPDEHGIKDERRAYYRSFGLFSPQREIPEFGRFTAALRRQGRERKVVLGSGMAGGIPFLAGEQFHFVDPWLCDPLLMRLPVVDPTHWRIGHFTRAVPAGYLESIAFDDNRVAHGGLRTFHRDLRMVLREPLLARGRLRALLSLLVGLEAGHLAGYVAGEYRAGARSVLDLRDLPQQAEEGAFWFDDERIRLVPRGGLVLRREGLRGAAGLTAWVSPLVVYHFRFLRDGSEVGRADLPALIDPGVPPADADGDVLGYLRRLVGLHRFELPLPASPAVFDSCEVIAEHPPWIVPAIGALEFGG